MRRSEEIQKLIDKVVLNEQVRIAKENLSEQELENNVAYLENPKLYVEIRDAFENDEEYTQRIEAQVEKNKIILAKELEPTPEVKEDNILMFRALKLMQEKEIEKENSEEYKKIGNILVDLQHLTYVAEVQEYIENFSGGKVSGEDEIRRKNKKVYDALKFMQKKGYKNTLQDNIALRTKRYLDELELRLNEIGDISNCNELEEIKNNKENSGLPKYKDKIADLRKIYEAKDQKYTSGDKYIIQYSEELQGKNYGDKAVSYQGHLTALTVSKQNIFQKIANKVKSIFSRNPKKDETDEFIENYEEGDNKTSNTYGSNFIPKADIDTNKAFELSERQNSEKDNSIEMADFE